MSQLTRVKNGLYYIAALWLQENTIHFINKRLLVNSMSTSLPPGSIKNVLHLLGFLASQTKSTVAKSIF